MKTLKNKLVAALLAGALVVLVGPAAMGADNPTSLGKTHTDAWGEGLIHVDLKTKYSARRDLAGPGLRDRYGRLLAPEVIEGVTASHSAWVDLHVFDHSFRFGFSKSSIAKICQGRYYPAYGLVAGQTGLWTSRSTSQKTLWYGKYYAMTYGSLTILKPYTHNITAGQLRVELEGTLSGTLTPPRGVVASASLGPRPGDPGDVNARIYGSGSLVSYVNLRGRSYRVRVLPFSNQTYLQTLVTTVNEMKTEDGIMLCDLDFRSDLKAEKDDLHGHVKVLHGELRQLPAPGYTPSHIDALLARADEVTAACLNGEYTAPQYPELPDLTLYPDAFSDWPTDEDQTAFMLGFAQVLRERAALIRDHLLNFQIVLEIGVNVEEETFDSEWIREASTKLVEYLVDRYVGVPGPGKIAALVWDSVYDAFFADHELKYHRLFEFGIIRLKRDPSILTLVDRAPTPTGSLSDQEYYLGK